MDWICSPSTAQCLPWRDGIIVLSDAQLLLTLRVSVTFIFSQGKLIWLWKGSSLLGSGAPRRIQQRRLNMASPGSGKWLWIQGSFWGDWALRLTVSLPAAVHSLHTLPTTHNPVHGIALSKPVLWQWALLVAEALPVDSWGAIWLALLIFQRQHRPLVLWSVRPSSNCLVQHRWNHVAL